MRITQSYPKTETEGPSVTERNLSGDFSDFSIIDSDKMSVFSDADHTIDDTGISANSTVREEVSTVCFQMLVTFLR